MIEVAQHEGSYLDICKYYRAMYDTPSVLEDKDKKHQVRGREHSYRSSGKVVKYNVNI